METEVSRSPLRDEHSMMLCCCEEILAKGETLDSFMQVSCRLGCYENVKMVEERYEPSEARLLHQIHLLDSPKRSKLAASPDPNYKAMNDRLKTIRQQKRTQIAKWENRFKEHHPNALPDDPDYPGMQLKGDERVFLSRRVEIDDIEQVDLQ